MRKAHERFFTAICSKFGMNCAYHYVINGEYMLISMDVLFNEKALLVCRKRWLAAGMIIFWIQ